MTLEQPRHDTDYVSRAIEVSIHVGLFIVFVAACVLILRPFLILLAWGIVVAIAAYPAYRKLQGALGGRGGLAAVLCVVLLLAVLIVPIVLLTTTVIEGIQTLATHLQNGTAIIPPPPSRVEKWPLVGAPLKGLWHLASTDLTAALNKLAPQINAFIPQLLSASAKFGLYVLQFVISIVVAGLLLANAGACTTVVRSLANHLFGEKGNELVKLAGATIRSVTNGILGVALIQSLLASLGFVVAGLPGAGLWTLIFLFGSVVQIGGLVLIPAVVYMFAIASATKAVIFLVWCVIVGLMDNVLKPLLLGRGVEVPMIVIFLGAIGGFIAMGIIGLFAGAIVLSLSYKLCLSWLEGTPAAEGQQEAS